MNKSNICPNFVFVRTADTKDPKASTPMRSDVGMYAASDLPPGVKAFCNWLLLHLIIEFKTSTTLDPYVQSPKDREILENGSDKSTENRGQMFAYIAQLLERQFRLFAFAIGIYGNYARFFRFDHSCVVVSERFDIHENARMLAEFFFRYSASNPQQRGFDPTITPATNPEKTLFRSHIQNYLKRVQQERLREHPQVRGLGDGYFPISRVQVNDTDGKLHWYLICRPDSPTLNVIPCGRFTRGFFAVPVSPPAILTNEKPPVLVGQKGKFYWLKDCWRPAIFESEYEIYTDLKAHDVPNIPEVICGGDVRFGGHVQQSKNATYLVNPQATWIRPTSRALRPMIHHRIVEGLLIPFECIDNAEDLVRASRDITECKLSKQS